MASANFKRKADVNRLLRYLNAAHIMGYIGFSRATYNMENFFEPLNKKHRLLEKKELERIIEMDPENSGGTSYKELTMWSMKIVSNEMAKKRLGEYNGAAILEQIRQFRGSMGRMYEYQQNPIPLVYIHCIVLFTCLYLTGFSFVLATSINKASAAKVCLEVRIS